MSVTDDPFKEKVAATDERDQSVSSMPDTEAVVDFVPGRSIDVYDSPFGRVIGSVQNGDKLTITGQQSDSTGVSWYKAKGKGYISSLYVKKVDQPSSDEAKSD